MANVYIVGIAVTKLGKHPHLSVKELTQLAVTQALSDAGCDVADIEAAWFSNTRQGVMEGQNTIRGQCALRATGLAGIPIFNVENACASSTSALALARAYIQSGGADIALVVGAEKMYFPERRDDMMRAFLGGTDVHCLQETVATFARLGSGIGPDVAPGATDARAHSIFMELYAALARMHMKLYGTTTRQIAAAAAKNHWHSTMNPLAQYQTAMSVQQVLDDSLIVWPLTRSMCAPISDGAAAAVICNDAALRRLGKSRAISILGMGVSSGTPRAAEDLDRHCGRVAALRAYESAGIGPEDVGVAEVHDASSFAEILQIENLGLCKRGDGGVFTERGNTTLGGKMPVNTSGGLVSRGHPIAATGLIQLYELSVQLRGEAASRQVRDFDIAIAENGGGFLGTEEASCVVTILGRA